MTIVRDACLKYGLAAPRRAAGYQFRGKLGSFGDMGNGPAEIIRHPGACMRTER